MRRISALSGLALAMCAAAIASTAATVQRVTGPAPGRQRLRMPKTQVESTTHGSSKRRTSIAQAKRDARKAKNVRRHRVACRGRRA